MTVYQIVHRVDLKAYPEGIGHELLSTINSITERWWQIIFGGVLIAAAFFCQTYFTALLMGARTGIMPITVNLSSGTIEAGDYGPVILLNVLCAICGFFGLTLAFNRKVEAMSELWGWLVMIDMLGFVALAFGAIGEKDAIVYSLIGRAGLEFLLIALVIGIAADYSIAIFHMVFDYLAPPESEARRMWDELESREEANARRERERKVRYAVGDRALLIAYMKIFGWLVVGLIGPFLLAFATAISNLPLAFLFLVPGLPWGLAFVLNRYNAIDSALRAQAEQQYPGLVGIPDPIGERRAVRRALLLKLEPYYSKRERGTIGAALLGLLVLGFVAAGFITASTQSAIPMIVSVGFDVLLGRLMLLYHEWRIKKASARLEEVEQVDARL